MNEEQRVKEIIVDDVIAVIMSSSATIYKKASQEDKRFLKVKIESADIDYDTMADINTNIRATLLNIQPIPFTDVSFPIHYENADFEFSFEYEDPESKRIKKEVREYKNCIIDGIDVKIMENIPTFSFNVLVPQNINDTGFINLSVKEKLKMTIKV